MENNDGNDNDLPPIVLHKEQTDFHKLVVPASMRSQYWRYFGFPADESNNILTRNKIVCCLCRRQIAYNKNTTNLSTHLIAKHIDIMEKHFPNDIKTPVSSARKKTQAKKSNVSRSLVKRIKSEKTETDRWSEEYNLTKNRTEIESIDPLAETSDTVAGKSEPNSESVRVFVTTDDGEEFIETLDYDECSGMFAIDSQSLSGDEPHETNHHEFLNEEYLLTNVIVDNDIVSEVASQDSGQDNKVLIDVYLDKTHKRSPKKVTAEDGASAMKMARYDKEARESNKQFTEAEVTKAIKRFIVSDVLSPTIADGVGFHSLLKYISCRIDIPIPSSAKIEHAIKDDFMHKSTLALHQIESLGKDAWYSLAFDKWTAEDDEENITISFNYLASQDNDTVDALKRQIVCIVSDNCSKYLIKYFKDLAKCSAALVNWDLNEKDPLRIFLQKKKVPIIQSFSSVLEIIVSKCFKLDQVKSTFELIANLKDDAERTILSPCWLTKFNRLNELSESKNIESDDHLLNVIQAITESLRPLKNCLDILSQESTTWASMMQPLAHSLISEHYTVQEKDADAEKDIDPLVNNMKTIIANHLSDKITSNWFLKIATFLDPRFHGLTSPDDRDRIQAEFARNVKVESKSKIKVEPAILATIKSETQKRNSLSSLFANLPVGQNSKTTKNRIETEIRSYTEDVNADIDQCPMTWWSTSDMIYPNLKSHVQKYFCVPSFVNEFHRLSVAEQSQYRGKCRKIKNEIDRNVMWLHIDSNYQ